MAAMKNKIGHVAGPSGSALGVLGSEFPGGKASDKCSGGKLRRNNCEAAH